MEPGTDHARAGSTGAARHDLICKPWCLFNLTADIGERDDLGQNPAYQAIAQKIAARLKWHGSTGPLPAYIWPDLEVWATKVDEMCNASVKSGYLEPLDANSLDDEALQATHVDDIDFDDDDDDNDDSDGSGDTEPEDGGGSNGLYTSASDAGTSDLKKSLLKNAM